MLKKSYSSNATNILFYSTGQGCEQSGQECGKWCVDCTNSKPCKLNPGQIPYCPANGASGEGCVRKFEFTPL